MTPDPAITKQKELQRGMARAAIAAMSPGQLVAESAKACAALIESELFATSQTILLYAPADDEPNLSTLAEAAIADGKTIAIAAVDWKLGTLTPKVVQDLGPSLVAGKYGIRLPSPAAPDLPIESIDLVVVPGVAFDRSGGRLGRGAGFYDRFLADARLHAAIVAIALRPQMVQCVPVDAHDVRVRAIATPDGVFFCGSSA